MKTRRGLSTVVGAIFFIIAVSSIIAYISISMDKIDQFSSEIITIESQNQERFSEEFQVTRVKTDLNQFNITVSNTGNIPIQIDNMWVENKTATDWVQKYSINQSIPPGGTVSNIGQGVGLTAVDSNSYKIKLVTERGNGKEFTVNSASEQPINVQVSASPTTVLDQFTTTVILSVTNNMTNNNVMMNVKPNLSLGAGSATVTKISGPIPSSYDSLMSGDTATFKYVYRMEGNEGQSKSFVGSIQNGYPENTSSETVEIDIVPFAEESGTTLESDGFQGSSLSKDILILHAETQNALDGMQMYSGEAENPTNLNTTTNPNNIWYTQTDPSSNVIVPSGIWNLNLRFISDAVPDSIPPPDVIYHFEEEISFVTPDSSGNNIDMNLPSGNSAPIIGSYGKHGSLGYSFDGDAYMESSGFVSGLNDIGLSPDTTSGWFKTSSSSVKQILYEVGNLNDEYYRIQLGNGASGKEGQLYLFYVTDTTKGGADGICSSSPYDDLNDGNWHHFVVVRDGDFTCRIYIDGNLASDGIDTSVCSNCNTDASKTVVPTGVVSIGRNQNGLEYFNGTIDQIFHWNNVAISQESVNDIYNADYGTSAHKFYIELQKVGETGTPIDTPIALDNSFPIGFHDSKGDLSNWSPGLQFNYSKSIVEQTFSNGERLRLTLNYVGGLNMTLRIDDPALTDPFPTFLQIPSPSEQFPSYLNLDNDELPSIDVFNPGPDNIWLTYNSRIVFDDINSSNSYASHLNSSCGELMDNTSNIRKDSPLIKTGDLCTLIFEQPRNPPNALESGDVNLIPPGTYNAKVFLFGYSENGNLVHGNIDLGSIVVVE